MMKWWKWVLLVFIVLILGCGGLIWRELTRFSIDQLSEDLHVVRGVGGNAAILRTNEGAVIVDTMLFEYQGERLKEEATRLTGQPVVMIINTHYHLDHTHGNPAFDAGTRVVATERTLHHMTVTDSDYFEGAEALMPGEVFSDTRRITLGNKNLTLVHPGRGHTDGDLVVLFEEEATLHAGDLFVYQHYPFVDLEGGGSVAAWIDTLDTLLALSFERVIPGHGRVTDRQGLMQFRKFLVEAWETVAKAVAEGRELDDLLETAELTEDAGYSEIKLVVGIGLDRDLVLTSIWQEVHGEVSPRP